MKKISILILSLLITVTKLIADEGMWLLPLIKQLNIGTMNKMGLNLTAEDIYSINNSSLKDAIVIFGGGCTGEMVSEEGLLLTNHHCGFGAIQSHSTVENDYLSNGFWAMTREEEIPTPGLTVTFLISIEDITDKICSELNDEMTEEERNEKINEIGNMLTDEATKDSRYKASLKEFFGGNNFYLFVYETYKDVRLVGAPPSSIGKFGGDTDNWMWPRHTGDFSIFRVYSDSEGKPAEYSENNIPYKPRHYLPISLKGIKKNDFAMILGYPGGTQRYMSSFGVKQQLEIIHPNRIKIRGEKQNILKKDMKASNEIRIKYASKYSLSSNYWKFSIGQSQRLKDLNIMQKKQVFEEKFKTWINKDVKRKDRYADVLPMIEKSFIDKKDYVHTYQYINECFLRGTEFIFFANRFKEFENILNEKEIDNEKLNNTIKDLQERSKAFYKNYNAPTDRKVAKKMFELFYQNVKKEFLPDIFDKITSQYKMNTNKFIDKLFDNSILTNQEKLNEFLKSPNKKILGKDLAFIAAKSIYKKRNEVRKKYDEYNAQLFKGKRLYIEAILEMEKDKTFYPNANFTMRLTYGTVGDYKPRDAVRYNYYTTLDGVIEKEDPTNSEFIVPEKLKSLFKKQDYDVYGENGKMPVCFTTNNDITGGNSGSPVINGNGELIGLAFDGNWEAMSGDIAYESEIQKCINVDIRYVLFIIDKFAGAGHLIEEMQIVQ